MGALRRTAIVGLLTTLCACGDSASTPSTASSPAVRSITVSGTAPIVGSTSQFTATATRSNGSTADVTSQATWQSSNTNIATVNAQGLVSAMGPGSVGISASYSGFSDSLNLVVGIGNGLFDIEGRVTDLSTNPNRGIVGARVVVTGATSGTATTDAFSQYSVKGLAGPPFTVTVTFPGYIPVSRVSVIGSDGKFHADFYISPGTACPALGFDDLTIDSAPVTTSSMCGFLLRPTTNNWVASVPALAGGPGWSGPSILFDTPAGTSMPGEVVVTSVSGRTFRFISMELWSALPITHAITGRLGSTVVVTMGDTAQTGLRFSTLSNPHPFTLMDSLVIRLTPTAPSFQRIIVDNIRLAE